MDNDDTTTTDDAATEAEAVETPPKASKAKAAPKLLRVQVLRAVDGYHHRGVIDVPNDEYHAGLLRQGNLKEVG